VVCGEGETCRNGVCEASSAGCWGVQCGDACVNPANDNAHCGACGVACAAGSNCVGGVCV
jgi:hypothetical protein